ncbi:MAG: lipid-binding SYLF domain-containing protein [Bryobacteraceae bacterium]
MICKWLIAVVAAAGMLGAAQSDVAKRLQAAADVTGEMMGAPDSGIPQTLLGKAQCVVIVPGMKKGAFIFGGKYGKGFAACRQSSGVGWTAPAAVRVEGGSFGFQAGGSATDVVMLVMNKGGMDRLLTSKFTLGADASVAAGPVGRSSSAQTDAMMTAQILTWSRSRGVFAGLALDGATLREDSGDDRAIYGHAVTNREILTGGVAPPAGASAFLAALNKYSSRK